jgi:hypothetical protein
MAALILTALAYTTMALLFGAGWVRSLIRTIDDPGSARMSDPELSESYIAQYRFTLTFRDRSRKLDFAVLHDRISMPCLESTPRKVRVNHNIERDQGIGD